MVTSTSPRPRSAGTRSFTVRQSMEESPNFLRLFVSNILWVNLFQSIVRMEGWEAGVIS
jgi:hypothetical protein